MTPSSPSPAPAPEARAPSGPETGQDHLSRAALLGHHVARLAPSVQRQEDGVPDRLRSGIEALSGAAFPDVRVHRQSSQPERYGAQAFARGGEIHLAPGAERHLPHEAWHVVQQQEGRAPQTAQRRGEPLNDQPALEREAADMGARAARYGGPATPPLARAPLPGSAAPLQLISDFSRWFIKKILEPLLMSILSEEEDLPEGFFLLVGRTLRFLEIDDTGKEEWLAAFSALDFLFKSMAEGGMSPVFGFVVADQIANRLGAAAEESGFDKKSIAKLLALLRETRATILKSLPEEEETPKPKEEHLPRLFEKYPGITGPLRRPGHLNPYRHGIGAADTLAILSRERRRLIARVGGDDPSAIAEIDRKIRALDRRIKEINDEEETPILLKLAELRGQKDKLTDKAIQEGVDEDTSALDEQIEKLELALQKIREGLKKTLREELRGLYESVFWISQKSEKDVDAGARARQVKELRALESDKEFEQSFRWVDEDKDEHISKEDDPSFTSHHSEQRLIVSREWLVIRQEVVNEIKALLSVSKSPLTLEALAGAITPVVATISINRSSCYTCNGFLVAELISLWKEIAAAVGGKVTWREVRDALANVLEFEISYSIPYTKILDASELDKQLELAGWTVYSHTNTEASDDEGEHEKLSLGGGVSSEVKKKSSRSKKKKKKVDSDDELFVISDEEEMEKTAYELVTRLSRQIKIAEELKKFFHQLARSKQGKGAVQILTEDLGFAHHGQPGTGLNCALFSIIDQLQRRFGIKIADPEGFFKFVRERADLTFGTMIDVLNNGAAVLNAVQQYLAEKGLAVGVSLVLDVWSATHEGVMEFQNVAQGAGGGQARILTLYYNGVNHFDSLTGGLSR